MTILIDRVGMQNEEIASVQECVSTKSLVFHNDNLICVANVRSAHLIIASIAVTNTGIHFAKDAG